MLEAAMEEGQVVWWVQIHPVPEWWGIMVRREADDAMPHHQVPTGQACGASALI